MRSRDCWPPGLASAHRVILRSTAEDPLGVVTVLSQIRGDHVSGDTYATGLRSRQGAAARAASLIAVSEDLAGEFSLRPLLERILLRCTELLGCTAGSICSVDEAAVQPSSSVQRSRIRSSSGRSENSPARSSATAIRLAARAAAPCLPRSPVA